ncbi:MAG: type II toxin-antitoxin system RelE family toxin [Geminicoccaceae bacterium]
MKLVLIRAAQRRLTEMGPKRRAALVERLAAIAEQPFAAHRNVERIKGEHDAFRLRQGGWRAVYRIDRTAGEMRVLAVEPRGRVYR